jgi:hypothetical protein
MSDTEIASLGLALPPGKLQPQAVQTWGPEQPISQLKLNQAHSTLPNYHSAGIIDVEVAELQSARDGLDHLDRRVFGH